MEHNPRKAFYRLFGQGDNARRASRDHRRDRQHSGHGVRERGRSEAPARNLRQGDGRRLPRLRARARAPGRQAEGKGKLRREAAGCAERRAGRLRQGARHHVRDAAAGLSGERHSRDDVHDGEGSQHAHVQPDWRVGCVPSAVASPERSRQAGSSGEGADLSLRSVRALHQAHGEPRRMATARCSITRSSCSART